MRVGCLGEVMLELVPGAGDAATLDVAGDTFNTAVYMARILGAGHVDFITVLGSDGFSARIRTRMTAHGIGADRVLYHPDRIPGLYAIETDDAGERRFTYWRSASAARDLFAPAFVPDLSGLSHLFYSGVSLAILSPAAREALFQAIVVFRAQGGIVAFDSNYRPRLWESVAAARSTTEMAWQLCDIALPSVDDEIALFGDRDDAAVRVRFARYGVGCGALKRGAAGPVGLGTGASYVPETPVQVVDSTAAGDSFNAAFLATILTGHTESEALVAGHRLAAQVVQHAGAIIKVGDMA